MGKTDKLLKRLLSNPKDFTWNELVSILTYFGYKEVKTGKTGGSRRKFVDNGNNIMSLHKPHPGNILKSYQLKDILIHLKERGKLNDE
ncbi:MAG: type II toxin-antitoxin system HicA family toxin [Bacteroidetes bacterium]|nr:type II toxin-antitoxin system HicA family toxin [Bacteroidota bacterium]